MEEDHEGGAAVFGDSAFAAPGDVEALSGFDSTGRGELCALPDRFAGGRRIVGISGFLDHAVRGE